jgi:hypothetical protein
MGATPGQARAQPGSPADGQGARSGYADEERHNGGAG